MASFIGIGCLYIARKNPDGTYDAYRDVSNTTRLQIQPDSEVKEDISRRCDTAGQAVASVAKAKPSTISIDMTDLNKRNLAIALMGDVADLNITSGSVTDEVHKAHLDGWNKLDYQDVSTVVVTDDTGDTTYVLDTDYSLNEEFGMIKPLSTGSITEGDDIKVSYSYGARTGNIISGGTRPQIAAKLIMQGKNESGEKPFTLIVDEATLRPTSPVDFISEDFVTMTLEGTLITLPGQSEPFRVEVGDNWDT